MLNIKQKVKNNFHKQSAFYDEMALVQKKSAEMLIATLHEFLPSFQPKTILDVGAGTGVVTESLLKIYPDSSYTVNDIASGMLAQIKAKVSQDFEFLEGDFETLDFDDYDLIVSSFALQWASNLKLTLNRLFSHASVMAVTCLEDGSFEEWYAVLRKYGVSIPLKTYPSKVELEAQFQSFEARYSLIQSKEFTLRFSGILEFLGYLKVLGANASAHLVPLKTLKSIIESNHHEFSVTYKVFFVVVGK
jgi:malonyl-CoA O-methyltransferase